MSTVQAPIRSRVVSLTDEGTSYSRGRFTVAEVRGEAEALAQLQAQNDVQASMVVGRQASDAGGVPQTVPLESLHKLQEELLMQQYSFTQTWETIKENIEEHVNSLLDGASGSRLPVVNNSDLIERHLTAPPPQAGHSDRPNTPTSTSAYSTSSCTSRTPPATTNGSEHRSGPRSRGSASTEPRTTLPTTPIIAGSGLDDNARESTLRMWSSLGDTLQEVVQRNHKLEDENRRLLQEMMECDQEILAANYALQIMGGDYSFQAGGSTSSAAVAPTAAAVAACMYGHVISMHDPSVESVELMGVDDGLALDYELQQPGTCIQAPVPAAAPPRPAPAAVTEPATRGRFNIAVTSAASAAATPAPAAELVRASTVDVAAAPQERPRRSLELEDTDALVTVRRFTDPLPASGEGIVEPEAVPVALGVEQPPEEVLTQPMEPG